MISAYAAWERMCAETRDWSSTYYSWTGRLTLHEIDMERARGPKVEAVPSQEPC